MDPCVLRDTINDGLNGMHARVSGAQYTRAGNIAVTPLAPCTVLELLGHAEQIGRCASHGMKGVALVVELDEPWPSIVARGVRIPPGEDVWVAEQTLCKELGAWNPVLGMGMKDVRVMHSSMDVHGQKRGSVRMAFATMEGWEQALAKGLYA